MKKSFTVLVAFAWFGVAAWANSLGAAEQLEVPDLLKPWVDWVTWSDKHRDCPTPYNNAEEHICFWPSRLALSADQRSGTWDITVTVFGDAWLPLPGSDEIWPFEVRANGESVAVVEHDGRPAVQLPVGRHQVSGRFAWDEMPQRIAIPPQIGLLSLNVAGSLVSIPSWDADGNVWLQRVRAEEAAQDLLAAQVYRVIEDGIPTWLRTEIELTVSGTSREEDLGWILPDGWTLSSVDSPIPVAVDDLGSMKAQVRAGKWTVSVNAFRTDDVEAFQYAAEAEPTVDLELVGFQAKPDFRLAEIEGVPVVDVTQTTFPPKWRGLPVYQWNTSSTFRLVEKMRGMGLQRPEGLRIDRRFWLDENGKSLTYRDRVQGSMQQTWRLDVAPGQELGAVRVDGKGQLITTNPQTDARGVEIRTRNLNLEAIGRIDRAGQLAATGWQTDADLLDVTLTLPPGWRAFAVFGADSVDGDWLTAWSLLDLFLLLVFSLAVARLSGIKAGVVAFLAFGLMYHELGAPRLTWLFLLMPLALLRVVPQGPGRRWVMAWKYLAIALLIVNLLPFVARQIQGAIYPQLESPGVKYAPRSMFWRLGSVYQRTARVADYAFESVPQEQALARGERLLSARFQTSNLSYDPKARIQTGPAEPEWDWNQVHCHWNGPVTAAQEIRPVLISLQLHRLLTVLRLALLGTLTGILFGVRGIPNPLKKGGRAAAALLLALVVPGQLSAQIPDQEMLNTLRQRLLDPADAYPHAGDIPAASLKLVGDRITMETEIHTAVRVAVPLPGRLPTWSPLSVTVDDQPAELVGRREGYLWLVLPPGVHRVVVEAMLPDTTEWEWTFLLKPRRVSIDAPDWNVTGVRRNGVPEQQIFFARQQRATEGEAAYDRMDFKAILVVNRYVEVGLIWQVRNEVRRLSSPGKAVSLRVPLLNRESVLTPNILVDDRFVEVRLGAGQEVFAWDSELPVGEDIQLSAADTNQWVERWHLVTSPVWNVTQSGLTPVFEAEEQNLIPVWQPWPGEEVTLSFNKPTAVSGDTITVQHVRHEVSLGSRQRTSELKLDVECSLGTDFMLTLDPEAEISSLRLDGQTIPVRRVGGQLIVPVHPGKQAVEVAWRTSDQMAPVVTAGEVSLATVGDGSLLPVEGSNVTSVIRVPTSRWVLWADGPLRGPAVRFWTILLFAIMTAIVLGNLKSSPLRRLEWVLLALGLTQVHPVAALTVVGWFFLLGWRGKQATELTRFWRFNLLQIGIVLLTFVFLGILVVIVGEGLLGNPDMFIVGNNSSRAFLQWFQPRAGQTLPNPLVVSISVWFYRLLMLFWALWLAAALLRWLKWGWLQFSHEGCWKKRTPKIKTA